MSSQSEEDIEEARDEGHAAGVAAECARWDALFESELGNWDDGDRVWTALTRLREWATRARAAVPR